MPIEKVVKTRHAFCSDECASTAYQQAHEGERKHIPMPERVKESLTGQIARSEAQQQRRALEKIVKPLHDCKQCGKPTSKLFCNDECRKDWEKDNPPQIKVTQKEIVEARRRAKESGWYRK